ncbi:hypothetical protein [Nostoc sp. CMAA1605]|uniref:hypothetical protein n=1 Tax=Nostoc sp. CMAA1605 TaxID=2055159 RepID=UPI001F44E93E|nr:hypothetical protein [Nostoc sp. CMAA1605]
MGNGDWGLGIGDRGLGIGDWGIGDKVDKVDKVGDEKTRSPFPVPCSLFPVP